MSKLWPDNMIDHLYYKLTVKLCRKPKTTKKEFLLCLYYSIQESKEETEYHEFLKNIYLSLGGNEL